MKGWKRNAGCLIAVILVIVLLWGIVAFPFIESRVEAWLTAREGIPIVWAIHEHRNRTGLFPLDLEELLDPEGATLETTGWSYEWRPNGWSLRSGGIWGFLFVFQPL